MDGTLLGECEEEEWEVVVGDGDLFRLEDGDDVSMSLYWMSIMVVRCWQERSQERSCSARRVSRQIIGIKISACQAAFAGNPDLLGMARHRHLDIYPHRTQHGHERTKAFIPSDQTKLHIRSIFNFFTNANYTPFVQPQSGVPYISHHWYRSSPCLFGYGHNRLLTQNPIKLRREKNF